MERLLHLFAMTGTLSGFLFFQKYSITSAQYEVGRGLAGVITFNSSHLFLTYALFLLPEFRNVSYLKESNFWLRTGLITLFWTIYYGLVFHLYSQSPYFMAAFMLPKIAIFSWHGLRQSLGLSLQETGYAKPGYFSEHLLVNLLWIMSMVYIVAKLVFGYDGRDLLASLCLLICLGFSYQIFKSPQTKRLHKILYLSRYVLFSLGVINFVFLFFAYALHGLEALKTFTRMSRRSRDGLFAFRTGIIMLIGLSPLVATVWHYEALRTVVSFELAFSTKTIFFGVSNGLSIAHCFMEEKMFRFKEPSIRKNIGPLIRNVS